MFRSRQCKIPNLRERISELDVDIKSTSGAKLLELLGKYDFRDDSLIIHGSTSGFITIADEEKKWMRYEFWPHEATPLCLIRLLTYKFGDWQTIWKHYV